MASMSTLAHEPTLLAVCRESLRRQGCNEAEVDRLTDEAVADAEAERLAEFVEIDWPATVGGR